MIENINSEEIIDQDNNESYKQNQAKYFNDTSNNQKQKRVKNIDHSTVCEGMMTLQRFAYEELVNEDKYLENVYFYNY